jgi:hypothetical protein
MSVRRGIRPALLGIAMALAVGLPAGFARAETCTAESFGDAVDDSAAELRAFSSETQPKLRQKLQDLRDHKSWTDADYENKGLALVHDKKLDQFDTQASELLSRIDTLGTPETAEQPNATSCSNLAELKAASSELMAVMRAKSSYLIAKIEKEIASTPKAAPREVAKIEAPAASPPPVAPTEPPSTAPPTAEQQPDLSPIRRAEAPAATPPPAEAQPDLSPIRRTEAPKTAPPLAEALDPATSESTPEPIPEPGRERPQPSPAPSAEAPPPNPAPDAPAGRDESTSSWSTTTAQAVVPPPMPRSPPPDDAYDAPPPGMPYELPPGTGEVPPDGDPEAQAFDPEGGGYSIDEIREATRGFFGTVSTSLASVIEHAFNKSGRPTGYVLGTEGGGAFLAGLRYGQGTLYLRNGGSQKVYWHGPSIGYDLGAEGSRTLFLIYDLHEADALFRRFTGIDGTAYLVGGVGMTLLKGGPVVMAPIRSGIGLRLGASIGYVRFTPRPTWNPF